MSTAVFTPSASSIASVAFRRADDSDVKNFLGTRVTRSGEAGGRRSGFKHLRGNEFLRVTVAEEAVIDEMPHTVQDVEAARSGRSADLATKNMGWGVRHLDCSKAR